MKYLLLQAYGSTAILNEALFCILTFLKFKTKEDNNVTIVVYTDTPEHFALLGGEVIIEQLDERRLEDWRGEINFTHRVKIMMLVDFFDKYIGDVLYIDSDTYFIKDFHPLFEYITQSQCLMHLKEGIISEKYNLLAKKIYRFLKKATVKADGVLIKIPLDTPMWNAGVLGISYTNRHLLHQVLTITEQLYMKYRKHIMEQLAFSYVLNKHTKVISVETYVHHYWQAGRSLDMVLENFFNENKERSLDELAEKAFNCKFSYTPPVKKNVWQRIGMLLNKYTQTK